MLFRQVIKNEYRKGYHEIWHYNNLLLILVHIAIVIVSFCFLKTAQRVIAFSFHLQR